VCACACACVCVSWSLLEAVGRRQLTRRCVYRLHVSVSYCSRCCCKLPTTMMCCYKRRCCLPSVRSLSARQCASTPCTWNSGLLAQETPRFIGADLWPPNSPDLNPVDYKIWGCCRNTCTSHQLRHERAEAAIGWSMRGLQCHSAQLTRPLMSGADAFAVVYLPKADTSNTSYDTYVGIVNLNGFVQPVHFYH